MTSRKMFGEYTLYLGGKVVAMVCNDQLYLEPARRPPCPIVRWAHPTPVRSRTSRPPTRSTIRYR
ncbi:TfoX/Sxy family protein [Tabrizicola sp.]|uniref:TfoX/Sxy family protein n=1 Tax=Tabrizicola sp. TaxID=2005166 RepID=UPI003A10241C